MKDVFEGGVMLVAGTIVGNVYGIGKAGMFLLQNGIGQGVEYLRDKNANNPNVDTHFKINLASDGIGYGLDKFQIYDTTTEKYNMISLIGVTVLKQYKDVMAMKAKVKENVQKENKK